MDRLGDGDGGRLAVDGDLDGGEALGGDVLGRDEDEVEASTATPPAERREVLVDWGLEEACWNAGVPTSLVTSVPQMGQKAASQYSS